MPIAGVLFFGWRVFDILLLYWAENVVIGVVNVMRMAICRGGLGLDRFQAIIDAAATDQRRAFRRISTGARFFMIPFFALHYGMFCFGHLSAVIALFGEQQGYASAKSVFFGTTFGEAVTSPLWIGIAAIAVSHLFSFITNFVGAGEYQRTGLSQLMQRPYGRIVVLHIAIIAGGALVEFLGAPILMLVVLVAVKTAMDLKLHAVERQKFGLPVLVD